MNWTLYLGALGFMLVAAFTPGPNNLIALSSGANFGYRKTIPHVAGVALGFAIMLVIIGVGLGKLFELYPLVYTILKYLCFAYLLYLAWKIGTSGSIGSAVNRGKPNSVLASALFQWVNPKAWFAAMTLVSSFTDPQAYWQSLVIKIMTSIVITTAAVSAWTLFGRVFQNWLARPRRLAVFNWTMAAALVLSIVPALIH